MYPTNEFLVSPTIFLVSTNTSISNQLSVERDDDILFISKEILTPFATCPDIFFISKQILTPLNEISTLFLQFVLLCV